MVWLVSPSELIELLQTYGLSLVEYKAMVCPAYGIPLGLLAMARHSVAENIVPFNHPKFSEAEYAAALEQLIAKGLLTFAPAFTRESARMREEGLVRPRWLVPATGSVVFTPRGFQLHQSIKTKVHGPRKLELTVERSIGGRYSEELHVVPTMREAREWLADADHRASERRDHAVVVAQIGPERIGRWRHDMFTVVPRGYRAKVRLRIQAEGDAT
jgi:hypothetical protein